MGGMNFKIIKSLFVQFSAFHGSDWDNSLPVATVVNIGSRDNFLVEISDVVIVLVTNFNNFKHNTTIIL
jgi:hypothetical protein